VTGFPSTSSCYFIVFLFILDLARCILVSVKIMGLFRVYFNRSLGRKSQWRVQRVLSVGTMLTAPPITA